MLSLAAPPMAKKPANVCTYVNVRIDDEVLPRVVAVAALRRQTIQDFISDTMNAASADHLNLPPVKRRPTPPKPHGKGRPPASRP